MIDVRELSSAETASAAAPSSLAPAVAPARAKRRVRGWEPVAWWGGSLVAIVVAFLLGAGGGLLCLPGLALGVVGLCGTVRSGVLAYRFSRQRRGWLAVAGSLQILTAALLSFIGGMMVMINAFGGFRRGRQLRQNGKLQLPPLGRGTGWITQPMQAMAEDCNPSAVADQWRENGRTEHASVAAFARLTLDLLGLGAPARLLAQAQADGQDEIRHAELCFSLATSLDGRDIGPVSFPAAASARRLSRVRRLALIQLAIDSLVEGALHEGLSAAIVAKLAKACETEGIRSLLAQIAEDEGRHAAHAWDVLEWCLEEGGFAVRAALEGALAALPETLVSTQPAAARDGAWVKYGIHDDRVEAEAYAKARASVVRRAEALLAA